MSNLYISKYLHEELDIILIFRLVYWYWRCGLIESEDTFRFKAEEVKEKLTIGLLNTREKIIKLLDTNEDANDFNFVQALTSDWRTIIPSSESSNNRKLLKESSKYMGTWFTNVWNVTSELLLAVVCADNGFIVKFDSSPNEKDHDYDFIVDGLPVQVKSSNKSYDSIQAMRDVKQSRKNDVNSEAITQNSVRNMILDTISNKISSLEKAVNKQKAKIIFFNATSDNSGAYFGQYCLDRDGPFIMAKSLAISIKLAMDSNNFVPLIFCTTSFRSKYYINTLAIKILIILVDGQKKADRSKQFEFLQPF